MGIWRGLPPRLMWVAPLSSVMFVYYELVRAVLCAALRAALQRAQGRHMRVTVWNLSIPAM